MAPYLNTMSSSSFEDGPPPTRAARRSSMPLFGMGISENKPLEPRRNSSSNAESYVESSVEDFEMSQEELNKKMQMLMKNPSLWNEFKQRLASSDQFHRSGAGLKVLLREFLKEHVELVEEEHQHQRPARRLSLFQGFGHKEAPPSPEPAQPVSHQQQVIDNMLVSQSNHTRNRSSHSRMDNGSSHHQRRMSLTGSSHHRRQLDGMNSSSHHHRTMGTYPLLQDAATSHESVGKRMLRRASAVATGAFIAEPTKEDNDISQDFTFNLNSYHKEEDIVTQKEGESHRIRFPDDSDNEDSNEWDEESEYGDEPINEEDLQFGFRR